MAADDVLAKVDRTIARTLADNKDVVVALLDLDQLSSVREEHRTPAAEDLVAGCAREIFAYFCQFSIPLHLHGDEFAIYFLGASLPAVAMALDRFLQKLSGTQIKTTAGKMCASAKAYVISAKLHGITLSDPTHRSFMAIEVKPPSNTIVIRPTNRCQEKQPAYLSMSVS